MKNKTKKRFKKDLPFSWLHYSLDILLLLFHFIIKCITLNRITKGFNDEMYF